MYCDSLQVLTLSVLFCVFQNYEATNDILKVDRQKKLNSSPFDLQNIRNAIQMNRKSGKNHEVQQKPYPAQKNEIWKDAISKNHVPSLMSEMYLQMQHFETTSSNQCGQPGAPGHVVRSLQNKGQILHQDDVSVVTELRFSFHGVFLENERIKSSVIYVPPPSEIIKDRWISNIYGRTYQYKIFRIPQRKWNHFVNRMKHSKRSSINNNLTNKFGDKNILDIANHFGSLVGSRNVIVDRGHTREIQSESLDVQTLVSKWQKELSKHQGHTGVTPRAVLIVTETTTSSFARQRNSAAIQMCIGGETAKLVIVSVDQTQCPENDYKSNAISREKREVMANQNYDDTKPSHEYQTEEHRGRKSEICQRYPMLIDFKDIGWSDWVIAPTRFQAYRCAGDCPFPLSGALNGTNHAMLMTMMNSVEPDKTPMPCCVPTKLKPVSLLYLDNSNNVVLRQYEDMVIESCGCR